MPYTNNPGQGAMFLRDKQGNQQRPDYSGTVNIAGKEYEISGWLRTSQRGVQYISLAVSEPYNQQQATQQNPAPQQAYFQPQAPRAPQRQNAPAQAPAQTPYQSAPAQQQPGEDLPF